MYLLSTVVSPDWSKPHKVAVKPWAGTSEELALILSKITFNYCGHPLTDRVLREICPSLPLPEKKFWNGDEIGFAARPKSGVRNGALGDTTVNFSDLEFCFISISED